MSKLKRRTEMQDKYCWPHPRPLPPGTVRTITTYVSDYSRQETILEWIGYNKDIYGEVSPSVWGGFLDYVEKNPDISIEELLNTFEGGHPLLQGRADQRFWEVIRLLKMPGGLEKIRQERMNLRKEVERNKDALCWTCTNLDYEPIYEHATPQSTKTEWLWSRDTSIMAGLDNDPVDSPSLRTCHPLPICPIRGVVIHKGYKHCSNYSKGDQTSRTQGDETNDS